MVGGRAQAGARAGAQGPCTAPWVLLSSMPPLFVAHQRAVRQVVLRHREVQRLLDVDHSKQVDVAPLERDVDGGDAGSLACLGEVEAARKGAVAGGQATTDFPAVVDGFAFIRQVGKIGVG